VSLHYLIDGYNLLYALPEIPRGPWPTKREILIELLLSSKPQGNNRLTVIFDSREGLGDRLRRGAIEVIFTASETADDWIARRVRETSNARMLVVVSNDQGIRTLIRGTGAKWLSTQDFLKPSKSTPIPVKPPKMDSETSDSITEEFKKKWLS
jgi:predicted RNA-binding protein with PIN domain